MARIWGSVGVAAVLVVGLAGPAAADGGQHHERDDGRLVEAAFAPSSPTGPVIFGVKPGGAPWALDEGRARVGADGEIEAEVEGLVIAKTGVNPLPTISAFLFCGGKQVAATAPVAFSPAGNAEIEATLTGVPAVCATPTVFLSPRAGVYIAVAR